MIWIILELAICLQFVPESIRDGISHHFINHYEQGLLAREENKGHMAHEYEHEGELANFRFPEALGRIVIVTGFANVFKD